MHSGSSNSVFASDDTPPPTWDWMHENVIWYDFTDATTIFQDKAASSVVTADGQNVQRVNNKSVHSRKISNHVEAIYSSNEPVYKTGGTQNLNYIEFDGDRLSAGRTQFGQSYSNPVGLIDGDLFGSDTILGTQSLTTFMVFKPDTSWDGSDYLFQISGDYESDEDDMLHISYSIRESVSGNNDHPRIRLQFQWPTYPSAMGGEYDDDQEIIANQIHMITHRMGHTGASGEHFAYPPGTLSVMWLDGYDASRDIVPLTANNNAYGMASMTGDKNVTFSPNSWPSIISIGARSNSSSDGSALDNLKGEFYEIIMFDYTLTMEQNNTVETYLKNKYNIS
tara:strand:+ start:1369 stop:2379 length:1011 start_codon:yes stop_codon:yes gene_type:complete